MITYKVDTILNPFILASIVKGQSTGNVKCSIKNIFLCLLSMMYLMFSLAIHG